MQIVWANSQNSQVWGLGKREASSAHELKNELHNEVGDSQTS